MAATLTSNRSFKICRKSLSSSSSYSSSESSSSLSRCEDEDFRGTESNPSDVLWKHIDNKTWLKGRPLLNSIGVCVRNRGATDLSCVGPDLGEEGFLGEIHDVVLCVFSLHDRTAVCSGQLALFTPGATDQLGVFILQPAASTWTGLTSWFHLCNFLCC